jgi:MFS transporter, PPP family, 3-phenylpropionic acid transporter
MGRTFPRLSPIRGGSIFYFAFFGALAVWLPFLAVYFHRLGLSGPQIGLLSALQPAAGFLLAAPLASLADRRGWHLTMLSVCSAGLALGMLLLMTVSSFLLLLPIMALFAAFYSPIIPIADSTAAAMAARYQVGYGSMRLWGSLSYACMAALGGLLWMHFGYLAMFPTAAAIYVLLAWFSQTLEEVERKPSRGQRMPWGELLGNRFLVVLLASTFIICAAMGVDMTFSGIYMTHLGGGAGLVGLLFGLSAMFELPAMRLSTPLVRRAGGPATLLIAYGCFAIAYLGYAASPAPWVMVAFSLFRGLAFGLFYASTVHLIHELAPPAWRSTFQGIMNALAFGLAQLISRPAAGAIYDSIGPSAAFVTAGVTAVLAMLLMGIGAWVLRRRAAPLPAPTSG